MRNMLAALTLFALLIGACGSSNPGTPSSTVLGTQAPGGGQATDAPAMPHY